MKRFSKVNSKKGFTLLEVMLAVAVMAIASTMIMQGFVATMNCSKNSKIFSRVGSQNYALLIKRISDYSSVTAANRVFNNGSSATVTFGTGISSGVYLWKLTGTDAGENTINIAQASSYGAAEDALNVARIDNRTAFFYIPTGASGEYQCTRGHSGEFVYCYFSGGEAEWATPAFRCIHVMDEYSTVGNTYYGDANHQYCFQYD